MTDDIATLTSRLADRAAADGLLDIAYRRVDSPIGPLLVARTDIGYVRLAFEHETGALDELATDISPRILEAPGRLDDVARALDGYFAGRSTTLDVPLDLRLAHGFHRDVVTALPGIGYGRTATYGDLAARLGHPGAARAVGTGCARNPLPILLPCHRVVPASGGIGTYRGGVDAKAMLLALESR